MEQTLDVRWDSQRWRQTSWDVSSEDLRGRRMSPMSDFDEACECVHFVLSFGSNQRSDLKPHKPSARLEQTKSSPRLTLNESRFCFTLKVACQEVRQKDDNTKKTKCVCLWPITSTQRFSLEYKKLSVIHHAHFYYLSQPTFTVLTL